MPPLELEGPEQMALDGWLLDQSVAGRLVTPLLRVYTWPGAWLSLGHHQQTLPGCWRSLEQAGLVQRVRRPSGGGGVLHAGGLTYALIWPHAPRSRREAYQSTSTWLIEAFARLGVELQPGTGTAEAGQSNCFASSTPADLLDQQGHKRIGSAQFWRRGHLLQHGEILIRPPCTLWKNLFNTDPPPAWDQIDQEAIIAALQSSLRTLWPGRAWQPFVLSDEEWDQVKARKGLYDLSLAPSSLSSPEACIDATA